MTHATRRLILIAAAGAPLLTAPKAFAASAVEIDTDADLALSKLYATSEKARELSKRARAVLIFPSIKKGGLIIGGQEGKGVMRQQGRSIGYYQIVAGSYGLQAGFQKFSLAMFFITQSALDYLDKSEGWAIGSGPSVVVNDEGAARQMSSTTVAEDVYAMPFGQKGLMAGIGLEGSKITRITPSNS